MRPVACFPSSIYGFLITLALPLVGERFSAIGFATVPAVLRELPQPSALRLSDLPRQMVADSLMPRELNEFMRAARYEHQQLSKLRKNTNRRSPWGVQVKTSEGTTWLDPAKDEGWDQVEEILEANPRCLEQRPPSGKGLLERLPLSSWKGQALQAAKDGTEPPYLKVLSRLLSFKLATIVELTLPPLSTSNLHFRKVKAVHTLISMNGYLMAVSGAAGHAAGDAAGDAAGNAARNAAGDAARSAALNAARDAARNAARNATGDAARNAAGDAAGDAARNALNAAGNVAWNAAWNAALNAAMIAAWDAATNAAWDAATNAAWDAARNAANEAITQLVAQSPADAPPSAELIGKTAYRSAELNALLSVLKEVEAALQRVFMNAERSFPEAALSPMFVNSAAWKDFKNRYFSSMDENVVQYWQPWLIKIDQFFDATDHPDSLARALLPEVE